MTLLRATALAFSLAAPVTASAADALFQGQTVTREAASETVELIRITNALDAAVDAKDWALARSFFASEVAIDFTSLTGGDPATIPADGLIDAWAANLTAEKTSFHLRGNHRVTFTQAQTAVVLSHGYAWNRMERGALPENGGEALWEVWGNYRHEFSRTGDGWKITGMTFDATAERGSTFVRNTPGS